MNDRLFNDPIPPREANPEISPELQEVIYRALERDPRNRYPTAREFISDLEHLDKVGVADRPELTNWKHRRNSRSPNFLILLVALAAIPIIFVLLLYAARGW